MNLGYVQADNAIDEFDIPMPPSSHHPIPDCKCRCNVHRHPSLTIPLAGPKRLAWILLLIIFWSGPPTGDILAQEPFSIRRSPSAETPWVLEADRVRHDQVKDEYVAAGNVVIQRLDQSIAADKIRFNRQTMIAEAIGNVVAISGSDIVTGTYMRIDLEKEIGYIDDGKVFIKENNYHIQGDRIEKTGPTTYTVDRATITTCDGDKPAWKFTGRDVKIHEDGSGSAKHAAFYTRDLPVLYSPYIYYPARKNRQTGLLLPEFSLGDRKGFSYNQPFFWAISDSQDATFYVNPMGERGVKPGIEYRYYINKQAKGAIFLDGFRDRQRDDGSDDARSKWGYDDGDNDFPRPNQNRYWFRMSHHQVLPGAVNAKLDLDLVSDQDYLREFNSDFMGFKDTDRYFQEHFARSLDDLNDPVRVNRLIFNKTWPSYTLNAEARWYQDVTRELNSTDTVQKLPFVEFNAFKQRIAASPFFYTFNSSFNNFWRINGSRAQRLDLLPRIYYPWRFKHYFTLEPSIGGRETVWYQYKKDDSDPWDDETFLHRELYDTRVTLFTDFQKVFDIDSETLKRVKHTVRPFISHQYLPDVDQTDLPNLESQDRLEARSLLTYSLTNTLTSKSLQNGRRLKGHPRRQLRGGQIAGPADYEYRDFLRLKVQQSYDFNKNSRPFLPILAELDFMPGKYVNIDADANWSVYDDIFLSHNVALTLWDRRGDRLFVEHRYDRASGDDPDIGDENETQSIFADLEIKATSRLRFFADYEHNIEENIRLRTGFGLSYQSQCWKAFLRYIDSPDNQSVEVRITLNGIGEFDF